MEKEPTLTENITALLQALASDIGDDYRSQSSEPGDDTPTMDVTLAITSEEDLENGDYVWQTGDNSYTGACYTRPIWAVVTLTRDVDCAALAHDVLDQWSELLYSW